MSYFRNIKENQPLKDALWEVPASFIFVILYFLIVTKLIPLDGIGSTIGGSLLFAGIWFLLVKVFSLKAHVQILPVISFTDSLVKDDFSVFLYRLPGQFLGALLAILVTLTDIETDYSTLFQIQFVPADAFFTGLFTGFIAQIIYFLYFFLIYRTKSFRPNVRLILFSLGLGILFLVITQTGNISLLNPFGILFSSLFNGHPVSLNTFLTGSVIHVIVPMIFIAGTHYFLTGFIFRNNQY
jgi:hypothetical protein